MKIVVVSGNSYPIKENALNYPFSFGWGVPHAKIFLTAENLYVIYYVLYK